MYFDFLVYVGRKVFIYGDFIEVLVLSLSDLLQLGLKFVFSRLADRYHFN